MIDRELFTERERAFLKTQLASLYNEDIKSLYNITAEGILSASELILFSNINKIRDPIYRFLPIHLFVIMKATRLCNLRCKYCHSWKEGPNQRMSFEVLCKTVKDALADENTETIDFVWHGGETLIMPREFYLKALWLQQFYKRPGQKVYNSLQTNAILLNDEWAEFFIKYNFSIGVSLDGPAELNDRQRVFKNGKPTSSIIIERLEFLGAQGIKAGLLLVIDKESIEFGAKNILDFLVDIKVTNIALLNVIPDSNKNGYFLSFNTYVQFLIELFDEWYDNYRELLNIRELLSLVNQINGQNASVCVFAGNCLGQFLTIEPDGDVSACDKYIGHPDYYFGNIADQNLSQLIKNSKKYNEKKNQLKNESVVFSKCKNYAICNGGCPHDNMLRQSGSDSNCCGLDPLITHIKNRILKI